MDDINVKTCVVCITKKHVDNFYNNYRECKQCNIKRFLKRHYKNKKVFTFYKNVEVNMHVLKTWIID